MDIEAWRDINARMWKECAGGDAGIMARRFGALTAAFPDGLDEWTDEATSLLGKLAKSNEVETYAALATECIRRSHAVVAKRERDPSPAPIPTPAKGDRFPYDFAFLHKSHGGGPVKGVSTAFVERVPEWETKHLATLPFLRAGGEVEFREIGGVTFRSLIAPVRDGDVGFNPLDEAGFVEACGGGIGWSDDPYSPVGGTRAAGRFAVAMDAVATCGIGMDRRTRTLRDRALSDATQRCGRLVSVDGKMFRQVATPRVGVVLLSHSDEETFRFAWASDGVSALSRPRPFVPTLTRNHHVSLDLTKDGEGQGPRLGVGLPITAHDVATALCDRLVDGSFERLEADKAVVRQWPLGQVDASKATRDLVNVVAWLHNEDGKRRYRELVDEVEGMAPEAGAALLRSTTPPADERWGMYGTTLWAGMRSRLPKAVLTACADLHDRPGWDPDDTAEEEAALSLFRA